MGTKGTGGRKPRLTAPRLKAQEEIWRKRKAARHTNAVLRSLRRNGRGKGARGQ